MMARYVPVIIKEEGHGLESVPLSLLALRRNLLQRRVRRSGRRGRVGADHTGLIRVETALTRGATAAGVGLHRVTNGRGVRGILGKRKRISALGTRRQNAVNQVDRKSVV